MDIVQFVCLDPQSREIVACCVVLVSEGKNLVSNLLDGILELICGCILSFKIINSFFEYNVYCILVFNYIKEIQTIYIINIITHKNVCLMSRGVCVVELLLRL